MIPSVIRGTVISSPLVGPGRTTAIFLDPKRHRPVNAGISAWFLYQSASQPTTFLMAAHTKPP